MQKYLWTMVLILLLGFDALVYAQNFFPDSSSQVNSLDQPINNQLLDEGSESFNQTQNEASTKIKKRTTKTKASKSTSKTKGKTTKPKTKKTSKKTAKKSSQTSQGKKQTKQKKQKQPKSKDASKKNIKSTLDFKIST